MKLNLQNKHFKTIFLWFLNLTLFYAQNQSNAWIVGYSHNSTTIPKYGKTELNFKNKTLQIVYNSLDRNSKTDLINTSIGDKDGDLLLFTEGLNIYGPDQLIIENGDGINPGEVRNDYNPHYYPAETNHVFLNSPDHTNEYYLFHISLKYNDNSQDTIRSFIADKFMFTKIVVDSITRKAKVISKNRLIVSGEFTKNHMAYCKHANGRDWWIIIEEYATSKHFIFLLDPEGIKLKNEQEIGIPGGFYDWSGNSIMSPDASKFIKYSYDYFIQIFDFDRCTGVFSNPELLKNTKILNYKQSSIAVSPNSQFLYVANYNKIWQFDLHSIEIEKSIDTVGLWDGYLFHSIFATAFYQLALADNGKIYLSCYSGNVYLHMIENPDMKGTNCSFKLRAIELPAWMKGGLPIMPNFALGPIIGSTCDSLVVDTKQIINDNRNIIYPTPIDKYFMLSIPGFESCQVKIMDLFGNLVKKFHQMSSNRFDVSDIPGGVYFISVHSKNHSFIKKAILL